jgi:hypothetical protein
MEGKFKVIDGRTVAAPPLFGETSTLVFYQLEKCLGPALVMGIASLRSLFGGAAEPAENGEKPKINIAKLLETDLDSIDFSLIAQAVKEIHDNMTAREWLTFLQLAFTHTTVDGKPVAEPRHYNEVFKGKILFMYKVLWYTLTENYADFFAVVGSGMESVAAQKTPTESPEK